MKCLFGLAVILLTFPMVGCYPISGSNLTGAQKADEVARNVAMASGRDVWPRVTSVAFTYTVREGADVKLSRSHLWNTRTGTDTITIGNKTTTIDVNHPADDPADVELQRVFAEDTQWLLTPLRLFAPGVHREYLGQREILGKSYQVLHLSFAGKQAVTPSAGDQYDLYIDPYTDLIAYSDYIPADSSAGTTVRATWEDYRHDGGLTLSTMHRVGNKVITLENLSFSIN